MLRFAINPVVGVALAVVFGLFALVVWYALLRAVPEKTAPGTILSATLADAATIERTVPRTHRGIGYIPKQQKFEIPERYVYQIELATTGETITYSNMSPQLDYEVGSSVRVTYLERSLPMVWKKKFISQVEPAGD